MTPHSLSPPPSPFFCGATLVCLSCLVCIIQFIADETPPPKLPFFFPLLQEGEKDGPAPERFGLAELSRRVRPTPPAAMLAVEGRELNEEVRGVTLSWFFFFFPRRQSSPHLHVPYSKLVLAPLILRYGGEKKNESIPKTDQRVPFYPTRGHPLC